MKLLRWLALSLSLALVFNAQSAIAQPLQSPNSPAERKSVAQQETYWRQIIQTNPQNSAAYVELGITLAEQKKFEEATIVHETAIRLQPDLAEAYGNLGFSLVEQQKFEEAVVAYRNAIRLKPSYVNAYFNLGIALNGLKRLEEAVVAYRNAIRLKPDFAEAYDNLGITLADQKKFEEAVVAYQEAIRLKPNDADFYYNLGSTLADQKKFEEAVAAYRNAIRLRPDDAEAHYNLGVTLAEQQKPKEAVVAYREAIRLRPTYPKAYNNLGNALAKQQKFEEAITAYQTAIRLRPDDAGAYLNLGVTFAEYQKFEDAVIAYQEAIRLRPDDAKAYSSLGNTLENQKKFEEAIIAHQTAIRLEPSYAGAYNNLGNALANQQKFEEAIIAYQTAIRLEPSYAGAYNNLGNALAKQKKIKEAITAYQTAIRLEPSCASAYFNLGATLVKKQSSLSKKRRYEWCTVGSLEAMQAIAGAQEARSIITITDSVIQEVTISHASEKGNSLECVQFRLNLDEVKQSFEAFDRVLRLPNQNLELEEVDNIHSAAYFYKGFTFWKNLDDFKEAIFNFKKAIKLDPGYRSARNTLKEVERSQYLLNNPTSALKVDEAKYLTLNDLRSPIKRSIVQVLSWSWVGAKGVQQGTGWIIHRQYNEAWIVTNRHVVIDGNEPRQDIEIEIELFYGNVPDDRIPPRLSARLVKATEWADALDLAVLKVDFTKVPADVQALLVDQTEPNSSLNSPVMIIGNNDFRQTTGKVISSSQNQLTLDFQLEDGNSGSPVLNSKNQVIGVIYRRDSKNGKSLAIPIDSVIQKLREWKIPLP